MKQQILSILPATLWDIIRKTGKPKAEIVKCLNELIEAGKVKRVVQENASYKYKIIK